MDPLTAYVLVSVALAIAGVASGRVWPSALPIALAPIALGGHGPSPATVAVWMPVLALLLALGELAAGRLRHRAPR